MQNTKPTGVNGWIEDLDYPISSNISTPPENFQKTNLLLILGLMLILEQWFLKKKIMLILEIDLIFM